MDVGDGDIASPASCDQQEKSVTSCRVSSFRQLLAGAMAGGAVLALAACGGSGASGGSGTSGSAGTSGPSAPASAAASTPTGTEISGAVRSATSVRISGSVANKGIAESLNLAVFTNGNMAGSVAESHQVPLTLIVVNKVAYVLVTPAFLKASVGPSASCNGQCGKYIKETAHETASLTKDISMTALLGNFAGGLNGAKPIGTTTVNGQEAIEFRNPDGSIFDIAASGPPYPLRASAGSNRNSAGATLFSEWNSVPPLTAPSASQLADPTKL
jgi:hypothetical protein